MSGRASAATEYAVSEYKKEIEALRIRGIKVNATTRKTALLDAAVIAGVHRTTLWRALNKSKKRKTMSDSSRRRINSTAKRAAESLKRLAGR